MKTKHDVHVHTTSDLFALYIQPTHYPNLTTTRTSHLVRPLRQLHPLPLRAHSLTEEFSYFTLVWKSPSSSSSKEAEGGQEAQEEDGRAGTDGSETSVFGISCTQQVDASKLVWKSEEVTRSAVQKAVVVLTDRPGEFGRLREKLSVVTRAWFAQRDFRDVEILEVGFLSLFLGSWTGVRGLRSGCLRALMGFPC